MPGTRRSTIARSCKDLSESSPTQQTLGFPQKKSSTSSWQPLLDTPVQERKTYSSRRLTSVKSEQGKEKKKNHEEKKRSKSNAENECCSPVKTPRKENPSLKSPLKDRTNTTPHATPNHVINKPAPVGSTSTSRKSLVFSDRDEDVYSKTCQVLHNSIPKQLIGREKEVKILKEFVVSSILNSNPGSMYICGAPGTGKTACLTRVLDEAKGLNVKSIFLNCMTLRSSAAIFSRLASLIDGKTNSYTSQEGLKALEKKLTSSGQRILLVLDEIDQLESKDQEILYKLFEMPFLPNSRLVLIGIANSLDFTDRILPRLQTKSECKPVLLNFQPYQRSEITAILEGRIKETGADIVDASAVMFCARKVSAMTGDARKALDILRRAVEIADGDFKKLPSPEKKTKVTISHVAKVCTDVYSNKLAPSSNAKMVFPLQQKVIICTLLAILKNSKVKEVLVSKLFSAYSKVCGPRHITPLGQEEFASACDLLDSQGIVSIKKGKDSHNNKATLRVQEAEIEQFLQDKAFMISILSSNVSC